MGCTELQRAYCTGCMAKCDLLSGETRQEVPDESITIIERNNKPDEWIYRKVFKNPIETAKHRPLMLPYLKE